jgi:hypothetical protein
MPGSDEPPDVDPRDDVPRVDAGSGLRRREFLVAGGTATTASLAGCAGLGGAPDSDPEALTPAPIPSVDTATGPGSVCPELPTNAEVYVCSPQTRSANTLRLQPDAETYRATADDLAFVLRNNTDFAFRTGRDWWTVTRRRDDGWTSVDQGDGTDLMTVAPGSSAVVTVDGDDLEAPSSDAGPATGRYALVVTGYVTGGELTAVIAPFQVVRDAAHESPGNDGPRTERALVLPDRAVRD